MNRRISFHEAAELEIIDAVSFFQSERPELGAALIDEIERTIHQILTFPLSCQLVNRTVRRKVLRRFPYNIMLLGEARCDSDTCHSGPEAPSLLLAQSSIGAHG